MRTATRFVFATIFAFGMGTVANAETVMKQCGDQWQAAKANGTTNGQTWPQFLKQCRAQLAGMGGTAAAPQGGFAPAAPTPAPSQGTSIGNSKTVAQCNAEYAANKAAIRASGQTKRDFVAACRAGAETIPQGAAGAPPSGPAPAQSQTGSLFPWQQPAAPAPAPAPATYGAPPTAANAGASASAQQVQYRCPGATVVWVNENSHIYHFPGTRDYGNTKRGEYMCEADAQSSGNRAAKNEKHP